MALSCIEMCDWLRALLYLHCDALFDINLDKLSAQGSEISAQSLKCVINAGKLISSGNYSRKQTIFFLSWSRDSNYEDKAQ